MSRAIPIESLDDPRVAGYRNIRDRDLRGRDRLFVVESAKVVERLLFSPFAVVSLLLAPERERQLAAALDRLPAETPVYVAETGVVHAISGYHVHGGALALAKRPRSKALRTNDALEAAMQRPRATLLACAGVTHMDNMGGIFRAAAGFGADGVLLDRRCCDPLLRKAVRVAMGHVLTVPFAVTGDLPETLRRLRSVHGAVVVALETNEHPHVAGRAMPLTGLGTANPERLVLVVGSEGHGLDAEVLRAADEIREIPMRREVPSLNVAMAATIALYERARSADTCLASPADRGVMPAPPGPPPAPCWD
ncbi:MAG: RNA methyltransferase [Phycisphaerales bacterium]|nr:RNA methyltransferase [Phycisphaerales bacterium]